MKTYSISQLRNLWEIYEKELNDEKHYYDGLRSSERMEATRHSSDFFDWLEHRPDLIPVI